MPRRTRRRSGQPRDPGSASRNGAVDRRLLATTSATRRFLRGSVVLGTLTAALVITQAWLLASVIAAGALRHEPLDQLWGRLALLFGVVLARACSAWVGELLAGRSSAAAKSELRVGLARQVVGLGPAVIDSTRAGALASLASSGIDALDSYFARYLPQVILAVLVPIAVIGVVLGADPLSALIIAVTVPLIPLFMALVGQATAERTRRRAHVLDRLAGHFVDVVAGLPTLRVFRRARFQAEAIATVTEQYRVATMATLRLAFLSSLILELLATVSVALVAVAVGLRLLSGGLDLERAFFVLIIAPEAYLPLRNLGASFHASADGIEAAAAAFDLLERPLPRHGGRTDVPSPAASSISVSDLTVAYEGRSEPALAGLTLEIEAGEHVAITGASGAGKSSLLAVLLGLVTATSGMVRVGGVDLCDLDLEAWRAQIGWVPQRPHLFVGSLEDNLRLGAPGASPAEVAAVVHAAQLDDVVARLPDGLQTTIGPDGAGFSVGERQRIALARALVRDAPLVLLDEPTAHLDGATERKVLDALGSQLAGRTVVLVAHRPSLLVLASRVVELSSSVVAP